MHMSGPLPRGISISGQVTPEFAQVLSMEALAFVAGLHRRFESRRQDLLAMRAERQRAFDAGAMPDFLAETRGIRESAWKVASQPRDLLD
ncbi:MAG TPA: malate synthase A, partial [Burkholderiales bacterium]|nr:malate synthase A [Burkholderiales bacterium]